MIRKIRSKNYIRSESTTNKTQNRFKALKPERKIRMEEKLLEAFNEMNNTNYHYLSSTKNFGYSRREVLEAYLNYEGIFGYTSKILSVIDIINKIYGTEE